MADFRDANDPADSSRAGDTDETEILAGNAGPEAGAGDSSSPGNQGDKGQEAKPERSLLDVVQDVEAGRDPSKPAEPEKPAKSEQENQPAGAPDNETFKDVPFHTHPRFQQVLTERNGYRDHATRYRNTMAYLNDHGVSGEEANNALQIAVLLRTDPFQAWDALRTINQQLLVATGQVVPTDLQEKVQKGEITWEFAQEISVERAKTAHAGRMGQFEAQRQERSQAEARQNDTVSYTQEWSDRQREKGLLTDENQVRFKKELAWVFQEDGVPKDKAGVKAALEKALTAITESNPGTPAARPAARPAASAPQRKPEQRPMGGGHSSAASASTPAKSLREAVERAMNGAA